MLHFDELSEQLPPIIARKNVGRLLGGAISPKTLANLDSKGEGPERMKIGRTVVYPTSALLAWLAARAS